MSRAPAATLHAPTHPFPPPPPPHPQEEELLALLAKKAHPVAYDGFEPSGRMHIAQGILKAINVNRLTAAGCVFKCVRARAGEGCGRRARASRTSVLL